MALGSTCPSQNPTATVMAMATATSTSTARDSIVISTAPLTITVMPSPASSHAHNESYTTLTFMLPGIFTDTLTYNTDQPLTCAEFAYGKGVGHITAQPATTTKIVRMRGMGAIE